MVEEIFKIHAFDKSFQETVSSAWDKHLEPFFKSLEQENDRAFAIISGCLIDNMLERLIRAFYIKDPAVKSIFKSDHMLQSLSSKINIAYFSGLLPKTIYHDLKIICEIRNKFAHETIVNFTFDGATISQRINRCELRPGKMDDIPANRLKFMLIVEQIIIFICYFELLLINNKPSNLVESFELDDKDWGKLTLTKEQIDEVIRKQITIKNKS
jgi:DNA-binding MltR family transcriptional regulator